MFDTTYIFDLNNQDQRRQYNNLMPLDLREIVLHGLTVLPGPGTGTQGEIDGMNGYVLTLSSRLGRNPGCSRANFRFAS